MTPPSARVGAPLAGARPNGADASWGRPRTGFILPRSRAGRAAAPGRFVWTAACLLAALLSGCTQREAPASPASPADVLRISQRNEPADLDPARATLPDEFFVIRALGEGLVTPLPLNATSTSGPRVTPAVAERWDVSTDGLTYTFHLRANAHWSDGTPVTAQDFVESYQRLLTPETGAPKAGLFFLVRNARAFASGQLRDFSQVGFGAQDARTFVVTLERPSPELLVYAASGPWIPVNPRVVARHGRAWTRPENFVGNGAFTLVEWRPHQRIVVRRNPAHHAADRARVEEIHFLAFDSGDTEERAFRAGQVDITMSVPFSKLDAYERERPAELHRAPLAETRLLAFNTVRRPLDDVRVRRALSLAIDRESIVSAVLRGGQQPADRFVSPLLSGPDGSASHPFAKPTNEDSARAAPTAPADRSSAFDPAGARRLLTEAGFAGGRGFPNLELSAWGVTPQVVEALQQMWAKELGIRVGIVMREAKVHMAALREGRYDIGFITAIPDVADAANVLEEFASGASGNYPHWSDLTYDSLLQQAAEATDSAARNRLLASAESRLVDQCAVTPLYFNSINWLMSPRIAGWQPDALWTRFYLDVEITHPR